MQEEIETCIEIINKGGIILYPTDTIWGIGCDANNEEAVKKVYDLKQRPDHKALICLVADVRMLEQNIYEVPEAAYDIIEFATKPTTIIYDKPTRVAKNLVGNDDTLAIRVAQDEFCQKLIRKLKRPLVSTSANISGEPSPQSFSEISDKILKDVDYVVNLHRDKKSGKPSVIIKLSNDGLVKVIRK
ncbi:L-threonylcarbamoyladenylate synthase [Zhouia sp. PK063]|uniref:L-threonylcarbamoyladenylate synthase n=1 Tax=Zhouia sp. PK063 TaxID=3373602 RepID=UPI0037B50DAD